MHATIHGERMLTELDFSRLAKLYGGQLPADLADLLSGTEVVPSRDVSADLVTMYSQVELVDAHTLRRQKLTICFPGDAEPAAGFISVLSPVGLSLIGLREGAVARWLTPSGEACSAEVVSVLFQPEASGDYTT
ncbi:GreA/GreB family elongation factor [Variovorax sp. PAMC 28711]|uniref:GreA/GreB family elongation factor n=1 Tax=Variovorax sp. PAMC 28711 TaxID=1795631 RepID=UPI00078CB6F1|nr:GreA/GreB family elongation factor [Variovorax sp. PAMC 28711]AMM26722.1 transcription elongation factor GreAB [Variovorax sp. PAMC 28711]